MHAWTASLTEIGAGALLVAGLLTPVAAAGVVGVMLVAWITNHRGNGFFIFRPGEGWEYVMTLTMTGVVIAMLGPGQWSIDDAAGLLGWPDGPGSGSPSVPERGGAALLLAGFWRPAPKPTEAKS